MPTQARKSKQRTSEPPPSGNRPTTMRPPAPDVAQSDAERVALREEARRVGAARVALAVAELDALSTETVSDVRQRLLDLQGDLTRAVGMLACCQLEEGALGLDEDLMQEAMQVVVDVRLGLIHCVRGALERAGIFGTDHVKGAA